MGLGDIVERALSTVGITEERVSAWLGRPCNCKKRRDKLNRLSTWARSVLSGTPKEEAVANLAEMAEDPTIAQPIPEPPNEAKQDP